MLDRQSEAQFWATVRRTFERLQAKAPDGFTAQVEVQLLGGEPIVPDVVQQIRPWLFFEMDEGEPPMRRVVATRPEHIASVNIRFVRLAEGRQPPGFRLEPPPGD